ncbi:MAG: hypothetical protein KKD31_12015, partial [Bacteroidetes bacterium]|nr:hypothetical protein [Bacteroidota bacterium]
MKAKTSTRILKKRNLVITIAGLLFFTQASIFAQPVNNDFAAAIDLTSIINSCSADAAYTTTGGSGDLTKGSAWNTAAGCNYNVWFAFTAPGAQINVTVDIGGAKGSQRRSQIAIWESDGTTEVESKRYVSDSEDITVGAVGLTPGNTYYVSVDAYAGYFGTFSLCLNDVVDYDYYEGAVDITDIINSCSADAAYTTIGGSADKNKGSTWNTGANGNYNRWFKFTASAATINATVDIGGAKGSQRRSQIAIWESDGTTEVASKRYVSDSEDITVGAVSLTPGNTYYISVDAYAGYYGTFTLCLDDVVDYDYYEGAIDITGIINSCSADAAYTTIGGSADKNKGSTWNTGANGNYNRWFKFTASAATINATVDIGGAKGSQRRSQIAIWESDGTTEVASKRYVSDSEDITVGVVSLTPGNLYYISVDAYAGYYGTFTLCLDDVVDYDYYEGAIDITGIINSCSA